VSSLTYLHLRPKKGMERTNEPNLENEFSETMAEIDKSLIDNGQTREEIQKHFSRADREAEYPKIVFLGTGSCIPNKTRNVSAILVHISKDSCMLLDCGEGTCGQLYRFYGKAKGDEVMRKLTAIYVSHLHADHHIGFLGLVQKRRELLGDDYTPVLLFAPEQIQSWLYLYDRLIERVQDDFVLVPNLQLVS
jgi:ribonuclease Z